MAAVIDPEISDEDIRQLLQDASERIKAASHIVRGANKNSRTSLGGLQTSLTTGSKGALPSSYIISTARGAEIDPQCKVYELDRKAASGPRHVSDLVAVKELAFKEKKATSGSDWFNLPRTVLTPELKRDLQLLRMRSVLDPSRHYKKDGARLHDVPEFSQVGTVIEGPTEFFTARLSNKERKRNLLEEVMAREEQSQRFKAKYRDIQMAKTSGKREHYKALKARRARKGSTG